MTARRRNLLILALVAGLLAASAIAVAVDKARLGLDLKGGVQLVYQGEPTPQQPRVDQTALGRAIDIMRQRVDALGVSEPEISQLGNNQIQVNLPDVKNAGRAEREVGTTAQLFFYDFERNAIGANGKSFQPTVQDPSPQPIPYEQAVKRAAKRPEIDDGNNTVLKGQDRYYLFSADHRLLDGPEISRGDLLSTQPHGRAPKGSHVYAVKPGTVVLRAPPGTGPTGKPTPAPNLYYVLADNPSLSGRDIKNPQQSFTQSQAPDVTFGFTPKGRQAFQTVTAQIAQRGQDLIAQLPPQTPLQARQSVFQHFAVALDTKLVTIPYISPVDNPNGIDGSSGADIEGGFTIQGAQDLATQLKLGALPIRLKLISQSQVSATLGAQALHQGLIAGAVGLGLVMLFLLAYYRVLGLIAVGGLVIYGLYLFALIKLIPITLTLPGIAGLILTIGVAADANIVIFERVKEEARRGLSVPKAIAAGYKKGLSAIVDANVVTIMTAFILFILATAGVKGFAFTLGIGTIVSLFTAVLATQAVLGTVGGSGLLSGRGALGAAGEGRHWRFDFMGASRWFFTLSGVILLVGALAVGARGLNFGIDFESGTRITTALDRPATVGQVRAALGPAGTDATIQKASDPKLGPNVFQISTRTLQPDGVTRARTALANRYGVASFDNQSVGPTFGQTVANSAVIAIIASLLVISAYIALRFEWKFAVPVLIALAHDILITAGVYALTGREVTTSTVAALLTILGYSLYDTIIVFDRVRENVPRMPRAAFSQIVNRSMSEVLTRSLVTTGSTLIPIVALLIFGGTTLGDFAFALLIGVASGAYSSIFIASPVLTHWKEREPIYAARRRRIAGDLGAVPAYATAGVGRPADVEPRKPDAAQGRLTTPEEPGEVSPAEFEALKRDLDVEAEPPPAQAPARARRPSAATATPISPRRSTRSGGEGAPQRDGGQDGEPRSGAPGDEAAPKEPKAPKPKPSSRAAKRRTRRHGRNR